MEFAMGKRREGGLSRNAKLVASLRGGNVS